MLIAGRSQQQLKLDLSTCLQANVSQCAVHPQAPAAALLLRSLASQDAVQLACDAARAVRLEQGDAAASSAAAESVALLATVWRFLGTLIRCEALPSSLIQRHCSSHRISGTVSVSTLT